MTKDIKRVTLRIPMRLYKKIKLESKKRGMSMNAVLLMFLSEKYDTKKEQIL
jgi:hypothetical protein